MEGKEPIQIDSDRLDFATGKSFGLANKPKRKEEYKDKLRKTGEELFNELKTREEAFSGLVNKLKADATNLVESLLKAQNGIHEKLTAVLTNFEKLKGNPDGESSKGSLRGKFIDYAENTFKKNLETLTVSGDAIEKLSSEIRNALKELTSKIDEKNASLVAFAENFVINIKEFERGYLYGEAIRTALSDDENTAS